MPIPLRISNEKDILWRYVDMKEDALYRFDQWELMLIVLSHKT